MQNNQEKISSGNSLAISKNIFTTKQVAVMGMMLAMAVSLNFFTIFITPQQKLFSIAYLPGVLVGMMYGPVAAVLFGFVSDTVKFIIRPTGGYFMGYAISEMASYLIYALFLYKRSCTIWRVTLARLVSVVIVVFGLNFLWVSFLYGRSAVLYYTTERVLNNVIQFPAHVLLTYFLCKSIGPLLKTHS